MAKQFAAVKNMRGERGGVGALIANTPNETKKKKGEIYPSISLSITLSLSPQVSCFPVHRYRCMNSLQKDRAQCIGFAALLRIRGVQAS